MQKDFLHWGTAPQLIFESINEYYRTLGHLTNSNSYSISYENNKKNGSYTDALRIHILSSARNVPQALEKKRTTNSRINCNEYVENLINRHNFVQSGNVYIRNFDDVFSTVPEEYISDFLVGFRESSDNNTVPRVCYVAETVKTAGKILKETEQPEKGIIGSHNQHPPKKGKRDYINQYIKDFEIGEAGESLVYKYECEILDKAKKAGKVDNDVFVKWISRDNDNAGYDILSYNIDKKTEKFIEVKTTTGSKNTPFYISENELNFSKNNAEKYYLYRLYSLKSDTDLIRFYIINGNLENQERFELSRKDYLVKLKSK